METPVDLGDSIPEILANEELSHREDGRGDDLPTRAVGQRGLREDLRQSGQELIQLIQDEQSLASPQPQSGPVCGGKAAGAGQGSQGCEEVYPRPSDVPASLRPDEGPGRSNGHVVDLHSMRDSLGANTSVEIRETGRSCDGNDVVTFGMHAGMTYATVWTKFPDYCNWVLSTAESGDSRAPTQEVRAVHRVEGSAEPGRHTSRSNGRGAVNKLLQGVVLASALGSALCSNYVGQVVSANTSYRDLEGPIFGDRVGIYHASSEAGPFTKAKKNVAAPKIPSR